jgi:Uma2 family endonuclease
MGDALPDHPGLRMTYDRGSLELMTLSHLHEWLKQLFGRLFETLAEEAGRPIQPGGQMTFRSEELERGFEPDQCYWVAHEARMRVPHEWQPGQDPPPDVTLEIEVTRSAINRLDIFAAYRVPEVWRYDGESVHIHLLQSDGTYATVERSPTFPAIPVAEIARFLAPDPNQDYLSTVRAFRAWVQQCLSNP